MKIKDKLQELISYLQSTRKVGHTKAMIRGAQNMDDVLVLAANRDNAKYIQRMCPSANVALLNGADYLRGCNLPLVLDNSTLLDLFSDALEEIYRLEHELSN